MTDAIDLDLYFRRIGYDGPREATPEVLAALHRLHPAAIPFESLDPLRGRPVRLDLPSLEAKLLRGSRGGYCFEQNGVFRRVLAALGFTVTPLSARVMWMLPEDAPVPPLSHMLLRVETAEGPVLCDVGFGGQSPTAPLRMQPGLEQPTSHGVYRLHPAGEAFDLQLRLPDRWATLYRFTLEPRHPADYEVANWFTSTHPQSRFTNNLIASRVVGDQRLNLFNTERTTHGPGGGERSVLETPEAAHLCLTEEFGLDIPIGDVRGFWDRLPPPAQPG